VISVGIRGAGVAGLSFAQALIQHIPGVAVSVFDRRPRLPHPTRTFGVFRNSLSPDSKLVSHQWQRVLLRGANFDRTFSCAHSPYSLVRGDTFFSHALSQLEAAGATLHWQCNTVEINGNTIKAHSTTHRFDLVVDAAFDPACCQATLWQSFAGYWVQAEQPTFDPSSAVLMDLDVPSSEDPVRFIYLLPTSPTTALIEHTTFSLEPRLEQHHLEQCSLWIERRGYRKLQITDTEYGRIPMGLRSTTRNLSGELAIGSHAGCLRASTGYAFQATQSQSDTLALQIAQSLKRGGTPPRSSPSPLPAWMRLCDSLFVRALAQAPADGQHIMSTLLRNVPESDFIPFIAGTASPSQAMRVMMRVPAWTMLRALIGRSARGSRCSL
jgi:lycopene beta-cyclase